MGDSVLIRLIIEQLRKRNPDMKMGVLAGPATGEILTIGNSLPIHLYSQKELSIRFAMGSLREIQRAGYDAVLNFEQGSIAGTAFLACTGIPVHVGFVPMGASPKSIFLSHCVPFEETRSMWQSFVALARIVDPGIPEATEALAFEPGSETAEWLEGWWRANIGTLGENVVALHLGCSPGMEFKRWPLKNFVALAERLCDALGHVTVVQLERPMIADFLATFRGRAIDASDLGSIERTAAILCRSRLLVSNDTGVMHLGAALGVATVGIFGPTSPRHWAPIGALATYVYDTNVACSPCVNNYLNLMPSQCAHSDRWRSMRDVTVESVLSAARAVGSKCVR